MFASDKKMGDLFKALNLRWVDEVGRILCLTCKDTFGTVSNLRRHISKKHDFEEDTRISIFLAAREFFRQSQKSEHPSKRKYLQPAEHRIELPPIQGLTVFKHARRCPKCPWITLKERILQKHLRKKHETFMGIQEIRSIPETFAQALVSSRNRRKLYAVSSIPSPSNSTRTILSNYATHRASEIPKEAENILATQVTTFVRMTGIQDIISGFQIPADKLCTLTRAKVQTGDPFDSNVVEILEWATTRYHRMVVKAGNPRNLHPGDLLTVAVPGSVVKRKPFQFVQSLSTVRKYVRSTVGMIQMLLRVKNAQNDFQSIPISSNMHSALHALQEELKKDKTTKNTLISLIHRVLYLSLIEDHTSGSRPKDMFMLAYQAAVSIRETENGLMFCRGVDVSSKISGVIYFSSCCAILSMDKLRPPTEKIESVRKTISAVFSPGSQTPIGMISKLRAICKYVRASEQAKVHYIVCNTKGHVNCGIIGNVEISMSEVGKAVKHIQRDLDRLMDSLVKVQLSVSDIKQLDEIVDDHRNFTPGYSFMSDARNEVFVRQCPHRVAFAMQCGFEFVENMVQWLKNYEQALWLLVTLIHITGGAPGRGTELTALLTRNTPAAPRNYYVHGQTFLTAPGYFKQVNGAEHCKVLTRHLDLESSRLAKRFFLFVRPMFIETMKEKKAYNGSASDFLIVCQKCSFKSETCNHVPKTSSEVSRMMKKYGIGLTFSQFRQFQAGYALRRDQSKAPSDAEESALQAGHTLRTARTSYAASESLCGIEKAAPVSAYERFCRISKLQHHDMSLKSSAASSQTENPTVAS